MIRARILIPIVVVLIAATALLLDRRSDEPALEPATTGANSTGTIAFLMEQQWLIKLKLAKAEEAELAPQIRSTARIVPVPSKRATVAPPVAGIIENIPAMPRVGQRVTQGQLLANLRQTPSAAEAAQIRMETSRIEADRRRLAQAEVESRARLKAAEAEADRARRLLEKKAYSQRQVETSEAERQASQAILASVQEQFSALQVPASVSTHAVTAPISGTVVAVYKSAGEQSAPGEALVEIVELDTVWLEAPIFEKDLGRLAANTEAAFTTTAFPNREFRGRLINLGAVVDEKTRAVTAIFEVDNGGGDLRIGMQANARIDSRSKSAVLLVPRESILDNEGRKIVYVLRSGEEFERRDVVLGDEYGSKVAIVSGVKPGERVVTQGAYQLKLQELRPANAGAHTHET